MATPFRLKRSAVADRRPTTTDLQLGELALNTHDGFLYAETTGVGSTVSLLTPWREQYGSPTSIYYNHRVGIGSTNPTVSLDVVGDTIFQSNLDVAGIATLGSGASGYAELFYQGVKKFETESWGTRTTGTVQALGGNLQQYQSSANSTGNIFLTNQTGNAFQIGHTSSNSFITGHVGNISINAPQVSISTNFSVGGISTFTGTVNINGVIEANSNLNVDGNLDVDGQTHLDDVSIVGVTTTTGNLNVTDGRILIAQSTAPQVRINSSTADVSSTRFAFGLATGANQFINGSQSNDACISAPQELKFGIGNNLRFRITDSFVISPLDVLPSANNSRSLGNSSYRWSDLFAVDANISGNLNVSGISTFANDVKLSDTEGKIEATGATGLTLNASGGSAYARIRTAGSEKVRITSDGEVGIGTTNPGRPPGQGNLGAKLHVSSTDLNTVIIERSPNSDSDPYGSRIAFIDALTPPGQGAYIQGYNGGEIELGTSNGTKFKASDGNGGRIGMGTDAIDVMGPYFLQIYGSTQVNDNFKVTGISTFSDTVKIGTGVTALTDGNVSIGGTFEIFESSGIANRNFSQFKLSSFSIGQHNNTGSYKIINSSTGNLILGAGSGGSAGISLMNKVLGAKYLKTFSEGSVQIYYDNVLRFETSGIGATVYGQLDTTDLNVSGVSTFQGAIDVDGNTELDDVNVSGNLSVAEKIIHAGDTDSFIKFTDNQIDIQTNASNKVRIGAGASIGIHEDAIRALTIGTGNQNNVLIRPNNGASNGMGNAGTVNNLIVMRVPYGENPASQTNDGMRVGMMMRLYNGNAGFGDIDPSKSASLYAVSEDPSQGYSRIVGLSFYTSTFNSSQTEKLRISGSGNVGIGTSGPTHKLEVNGNTLLKDNLTVSGISTFGNNVIVENGSLEIKSVTPQLIFNDTTGTPDYKIRKQSGNFMIMETGQTNDSEWRLSIRNGGTIDIPGNLDTHGNLDVDGRTELDVTNISETLNVTGISTFGNTVSITAPESTDAILELIADEGDDNGDKWRIRSQNGTSTFGGLHFETYASGSWSNGTPLKILSNGSVFVTGQLIIDKVNINDNVIQLNSGTDDLKIRGNGTGGTNHLTLDDDITVAGTATFEDRVTISGGKDLQLLDNGVIRLGNSSNTTDFQMFHNGTHTYINNGTGSLYITNETTSGTVRISAKAGHNGITVHHEGSVDLYHNNVKRLETTNTGVSITDNLKVAGISTFVGMVQLDNDVYFNTANNGDIQFDTSDNSLKIGYNQGLNDQVKLKFGSSGTFQIFKHSVSGAFIDNGGGNFYIRNKSGFPLHLMANATDEGVLIKNNAEVELYYDDEIRFETTAYGALLTGGTSGIGTIAGPATFHIDPVTVGDNTGTVVIKGNLQVDGTTTTINSTTVSVDDKNLELGSGAANDAAADGGGITIISGEGNKTFQFEATGDNLGSSEHINIATGKVYKVNNVETLSATTLGSAVVNSSLTNLGTLTSLDVNGHTELDNLNVSGISTFNDDVKLGDSSVLGLGSAGFNSGLPDLRLYHNGNSSNIINNTGHLYISQNASGKNLYLKAPVIQIQDSNSNDIITTATNGGITVKHNNSTKLQTQNYGVEITGTLDTDKLNVSGISTFTGNIDINSDLDVDGRTELDITNISETLNVVGVSTFSGDVHIGSAVLTNPSGDTVDFNGSITASDVVTAGALLHEGDTDTLVHFSAADTIDFKTFGIARLTVNNFGVTLGATLNANGQRIIFGDSLSANDDRLVLGLNNDLVLYHDSVNSYIENNTGILKILGNTIQLGDGTDKVGINSTSPTHELEVLGDSSLKGNLTVSGLSTFSERVTCKNLLASSDGNTSISILDTGHGFNATTLGLSNGGRDFAITAPRDIRLRPSGGLNGIVIENNGPVELYHANVKKAATSASGLDVTGNISCTGTVDIDGQVGFGTHITLEDYGEIQLGEKSGGDLKIYHDPTLFGDVFNVIESTNGNVFFVNKDTSKPYMYIRSNDIQLRDWSNNHAYIHCKVNQWVRLYYANQRRFETTSTGAVIIDSAASNSGISCNLDLYNNGNNNGDGSSLSFKRSPGDTRAQIIAVKNETSNNETDLVFKTTKNAGTLVETLRILGDTQRVGIGTDNPQAKLETYQSGTTGYLFRAMAGLSVGNRSYDLKPPSSNSLTEPFSWNTGNAHAFQVDGVEALRIDSSGRVLIGTTTEGHPDADDLTIATSGATGITIRSGTSSFGHIYFSDGTSGGDELEGAIEYFHHSNYMQFRVGQSRRLRITSDGKMSLGTSIQSNPAAALHIDHDSNDLLMLDNSTAATQKMLFASNGGTHAQIYATSATGALTIESDPSNNHSNSFIDFRVDGSERLRINEDGNVGISSGLTVAGVSTFTGTGHFNSGELRINGTNVASLHFNSSTNNPDYRVQNHSGELQLYDATNDKYRFIAKTNGRVGINTHNPLRDFHVVGTSRFEQLDVIGFSTFASGTRFFHHTPRIEMQGNNTATISFCNATTGTTNSDGMLMGFSSSSQVGFINVNESGHGFVLKTGSSAQSSERIRVSGVGTFSIRNGTEEMVNARPNLGVELYFNGIKRLETTGTGVDIDNTLKVVGVGTFGDKVKISSNVNALSHPSVATNYHLHLTNPQNDAGETVGIAFGLSTGDDIGAAITHERESSNSVGNLRFYTKENTSASSMLERMRISKEGNVGINSTAPTRKLEVVGENGSTATFKSAVSPHLLVTSDANLNEHLYTSVRNGITIKSTEATLDLIAQGSGTHAGSFLMRDSSHDGFGFVNDFDNKELQLKSFTTSGIAFRINSTGANVSRLDDCIVIKKDGSVKLFNDGNKRLETTGTGVDITDNLNVAGITTSTGVINSQTDIRINNVSVIETALNDAVAMAIALG